MSNRPNPTELIAALKDIETNAGLSRQITTATRHAAYMGEVLDTAIPALAHSYGIEPTIDLRRGRIHSKALALRRAFSQAATVRRDLPVPAALAGEVRALQEAAGDLCRDTENFLAAK
jgi:hypothetical protein